MSFNLTKLSQIPKIFLERVALSRGGKGHKRTTLLFQAGRKHYKAAIIQQQRKANVIVHFLKENISERANIESVVSKMGFRLDEVVIVLARDQVTVRNIELPAIDAHEIADIVNIQAAKQTPFSKEEIIADYKVLGSSREHYSSILLAIVQKAIVSGSLNYFPVSKNVQQVILGSECLGLLSPAIEQQIKDDVFAVIDCEADCYDFCVFSKHKLLFTRSLQFNDQDFEKDGGQKQFIAEINCSREVYRAENIGPSFAQVVLIGEKKVTEKILKWVSGAEVDREALGMTNILFRTVDYSAVLQGVRFSEEAETMLKLRENESFIKLIGLASREIATLPFLNFLPSEIKRGRQQGRQTKEFTKTGIILFFVLILAVGGFMENRFSQSLLLQSLSFQLMKVEKASADVRKVRSKNDLITDHLNVKNSVIEIFIKVYKVIPQAVYLSAIDFDRGKTITLRGTASSVADVSEFSGTLQGLPHFESVETEYFSERNVEEKVLIDFEIKCLLSK